MNENEGYLVVMIYVTVDGKEKETDPGERLYQGLTCNGSIGPSEIAFLAPSGIKYSDDEPTLENVKRTFSMFSERSRNKPKCLVWVHSSFTAAKVELQDGPMDIASISDLIDSLMCCSVRIVLDGPGSDLAAETMKRYGRVMIFSKRIDGAEKTSDPFDVPSIFRGDRIDHELVYAERQRLEREGYVLIWLEGGPMIDLIVNDREKI
jgi:hypothetical protein